MSPLQYRRTKNYVHHRIGDEENVKDYKVPPIAHDGFVWGQNVGKIHPLFRLTAFSNVEVYRKDAVSFVNHPMSSTFYTAIRPALRLATILLERSRPFFMSILYADLHTVSDANELPELDSRYMAQLVRRDLERYEKDLDKFSQRLCVCWLKQPRTHRCCTYTIYGAATVNHVPHIENVDDSLIYRISCIDDMWQTMMLEGHSEENTHESRLVGYIGIATTLLHELAHALWYYRHRHEIMLSWQRHTDFDLQEPQYDYNINQEPNDELGFAWERWMFGGELWPGEGTAYGPCGKQFWIPAFDGRHGLELRKVDYEGRPRPSEPVANTSVRALLLEDTWSRGSAIPLYLLPEDDESDSTCLYRGSGFKTRRRKTVEGHEQRDESPICNAEGSTSVPLCQIPPDLIDDEACLEISHYKLETSLDHHEQSADVSCQSILDCCDVNDDGDESCIGTSLYAFENKIRPYAMPNDLPVTLEGLSVQNVASSKSDCPNHSLSMSVLKDAPSLTSAMAYTPADAPVGFGLVTDDVMYSLEAQYQASIQRRYGVDLGSLSGAKVGAHYDETDQQ